ncbi:diacylglycerol kinase [Thiothrix subterranea]|uniref:Diacylglycerol kinase n=2 Tax=Thiothrix subterranea TaxID=2735563 RepID=A0AA51MQA9_9GAMM|nr:diacylglycerol kinase [Thiothrix subterranea]MDQ5769036.1 diacylglycerol kinase [Thiothrix subterranea]QQZ29769.1 diacylglycerol kinase [Thiothrix subterranea]WML88405.1 diacylglycerol kinase [Thiothrix subterranea]
MKNKFLGTGDAGYHPLRKFRTVLSGLSYAVKYDFSVTYKLVLSVIVLIVAFAFRGWVDFLMVLVATTLVLMAELFNSAIEALCDFVEERHNEKIKVIKDIAAAAVGVSILLWVIVIGMELWSMLTSSPP